MGEGERPGAWLGSVGLDPAALDGFGGVDTRTVVDALFAGIDPGKKGHIALIDEAGVRETWEMPTVGKTYDLGGVARIAHTLAARGVLHVTLDRQQPAYNRGKAAANNSFTKASFGIGYGYALWQMALFMAHVPHSVVLPAVWKRVMGVLVPSSVKGTKERQKAAKEQSVGACQTIYPDVDLRRNDRCRVACPDKAEAILLARYGLLNARAA